MNKIYEDAKDLHVRSILVYGKKANHKLYYEPDYKTQVTLADANDAFTKGSLMIVDGDYYRVPVAIAGNKVLALDKTGEPYEAFSTESTYAVGDVVLYDGAAYKCKTAIGTAGDWDASKWDEIVTVDFVEWLAKA